MDSTTPKSLLSLIAEAFSFYFKTLKAIFPLILLIAFVKDLPLYLGGLPNNHWLRLILIFVILLFQIYLISVAFLMASTILKGETIRLNAACRAIYGRLSGIYMGFFSIVLIFCAVFFIGYLLTTAITYYASNKISAHNISLMLLVGLPLTYLLVALFFVIPLLALETFSIREAFRKSLHWVGYKNWLKTFVVYAISVLLVFVISSATRHGQWLLQHHISFVFDVIVLSLVLPWLINLIILLLNDLRLRSRE